jgi:hypothetical protein
VETDPETLATIKEVNDEFGIQWLFSFLSADKRKTYCLYEAPSAAEIRAAAERLGCRPTQSLRWTASVRRRPWWKRPVRDRRSFWH